MLSASECVYSTPCCVRCESNKMSHCRMQAHAIINKTTQSRHKMKSSYQSVQRASSVTTYHFEAYREFFMLKRETKQNKVARAFSAVLFQCEQKMSLTSKRRTRLFYKVLGSFQKKRISVWVTLFRWNGIKVMKG